MSTMPVQDAALWQRGADGEDRFDDAIREAGLYVKTPTRAPFCAFRNVKWRVTQGDLNRLGGGLRVETTPMVQALAKTDIDFVIVGPTGVWVWDVKNWRSAHNPEYLEGAARKLIHQSEFIQLTLGDALDEMGQEVHAGIVMMDAAPEQKYYRDVPFATPDEAIEMMRDSPLELTGKMVWMLSGYMRMKLAWNGPLPKGG